MTVIDLQAYKLKKLQENSIKPGDKIRWHCPIFNEYHEAQIVDIVKSGESIPSLNTTEDIKEYWIKLEEGSSIQADLFVEKIA